MREVLYFCSNKLLLFNTIKRNEYIISYRQTTTPAPAPSHLGRLKRLVKERRVNERILCDETLPARRFKKERDSFAQCFFARLNAGPFNGELTLDSNVTFEWSKTLNKTAGDCRLMTRNRKRTAHIRLA